MDAAYSLNTTLESLACEPGLIQPTGTLRLAMREVAAGTCLLASLDVGAAVHLVRRPCMLDATAATAVMALPSGLELAVCDGDGAPLAAQRTVAGVPLSLALTAPGGQRFAVSCEVHDAALPPRPSAAYVAAAAQLAAAAAGLSQDRRLSWDAPTQTVSLEAAEHHLAQIDQMLLGLERTVAPPALATAAAAEFEAFGGAAQFLFPATRLRLEPRIDTVRVRALLGRLRNAEAGLAQVRVGQDSAALSTVAARHLADADLGLFCRNMHALLAQRAAVATDLVRGRARRQNRTRTRLSFHALQTLDASIRAHVDSVCQNTLADGSRERGARLFEMRQLAANNENSEDRMSPEVFEHMIGAIAAIPGPPAAAAGPAPRFETPAARSLHAAMLLQSLPAQKLPFAPTHNFSYVKGALPAARVSGDAAFDFLAQKIATDERHEIIPSVLSTHIRGVMQASRESPHPPTLAAQVASVVAIFDTDIQPLVLSALAGGPVPPFTFLESSEIRTGYQKRPTRSLMLEVLGF